jgi:hypothetical protein
MEDGVETAIDRLAAEDAWIELTDMRLEAGALSRFLNWDDFLSMKLKLLGLLLALGAPLSAQSGIGAKYGTRDPHACANMKAPAKGVLSPAQALQYFTCVTEGVSGDNLYLVTDAKIEVGKGTPFKELGGGSRPGNADVDGIVYQIRGSYKKYQCAAVSTSGLKLLENAGKNCRIYNQPNATGICYRDQFGDWQCHMLDLNVMNAISEQPPLTK